MAYKGELIPAHCPDPDHEPKWLGTLRLLARDKHFDWVQGMARYWTQKLRAYPEPLVEHTLMETQWRLFPSADEVIETIEVLREEWRQEAAERSWQNWKLEQERAGREGLLATDADYAELREGMKRLGMSKPMDAKPAEAAKAPAREPLTDAQFHDRKEILRQQIAQLEAMRKV